jgi:hypothetical protein
MLPLNDVLICLLKIILTVVEALVLDVCLQGFRTPRPEEA